MRQRQKGDSRHYGTWTHTSDDSYIYQLSLVLATAFVYFIYKGSAWVEQGSTSTCSIQYPIELNPLLRNTVGTRVEGEMMPRDRYRLTVDYLLAPFLA